MFNQRRAILWLLSLAAVAVGVRNFEPGLTLDGPVYATVARAIAEGGDWFRLDAFVPDFIPFVEHPHLNFWLGAILFKILPAADWSARILGHLFYVGFLSLFYFYLARRRSEKIAVLSVLILWSFFRFSNVFSNFYLDPGVLFFGAAAVFLVDAAQRSRTFFLAGIFFALAAMVKGVTVIGFVPALTISLALRGTDFRKILRPAGLFWGGLVLVSSSYLLALSQSRVPDFLQLYWARQITHRFANQWTVAGLFNVAYWRNVLQATYYLAPLVFFSLRKGKLKSVALPWALFFGFAGQFSISGLVGSQYLIMVLPWIAWLIAEGIETWFPFNTARVMTATIFLSWFAVAVIQYFPVRVHGTTPPPEAIRVGEWHPRGVGRLYFDKPPETSPFMPAASFTWYGRVRVEYINDGKPPPADPKSLYFCNASPDACRRRLEGENWCWDASFSTGTLWRACSLI